MKRAPLCESRLQLVTAESNMLLLLLCYSNMPTMLLEHNEVQMSTA